MYYSEWFAYCRYSKFNDGMYAVPNDCVGDDAVYDKSLISCAISLLQTIFESFNKRHQ